MPKINNYKIPRAGLERELLREKGQFWTPDWIAEAMVEYVLADGSDCVFDPAVGTGAFFRAAKTIAREKAMAVAVSGMDIDPVVLEQSQQYGLSTADMARVKVADFIFEPPANRLRSIVANPPYIRHHRLPLNVKEKLKAIGVKITRNVFDGRAGLHIYFLIRALELLDSGGRLAFIMPADTCEGVFAPPLWGWITRNFCLDVVVTFDPKASPFPQVDTNPIIFMIRNVKPQEHFFWVRCHEAHTPKLKAWIRSGYTLPPQDALSITYRQLTEGIATGLSRSPSEHQHTGPTLGDFAKVLRGVATGANQFFFLTHEQAARLKIPSEFFVTAIGRTRDVPGNEITQEIIDTLKVKGRPTWLLSLSGRPIEDFPKSVRLYLQYGEEIGLPKRPLISQRRPWYKMETRFAPPILFAYLGRRNSRFIRNYAGVTPLTCFLCVYPNQSDQDFIDKVWQVLRHPETISNLPLIGKSYGSGAVKVEPRSLEKLPLPEHVVNRVGLPYTMRLLENRDATQYQA